MNQEEFQERLFSLRTRGEIKRFAKEIERNISLQQFLLQLLNKHGYTEVSSIKKQIRILLDRSSTAQIRKNPIFRDESFVCIHCKRDVPIGGVKIRDHCPFCLWGMHLDNVPGDRSAQCDGRMKPMSLESISGKTWIHYKCTSCAHQFRVCAHPDDQLDVL